MQDQLFTEGDGPSVGRAQTTPAEGEQRSVGARSAGGSGRGSRVALLGAAAVTLVSAVLLSLTGVVTASHIPGMPCKGCASHKHWPKINGVILKAKIRSEEFTGTAKSDQLMGHHGSDVLRSGEGSDVLWGDWDAFGQPSSQRDRIDGGGGKDFIYGSHGHNTINGGPGNDAISVHYGRGEVNCGPGRDIYHVAKTRKKGYRFRNCEKVDYRSERQRGGGLKPLP